MNRHELTTYPDHISFLKDFPKVSEWLNCNGYTILYSYHNFKMHTTYSFWDDHTSDAEKKGVNDAQNTIMVTYCQSCKTIELYHRAIISNSEKTDGMIDIIDAEIYGPTVLQKNFSQDSDSFLPEEFDVEKFIDDIEKPRL